MAKSPCLILASVVAVFAVIDARLLKISTENDVIEIDVDDSKIGEHVSVEISEPEKEMDSVKWLAPADDDTLVGGCNCTCPAKSCDSVKCRLPNCRCSGDDVPGGLSPATTPLMVVLTFQNAVHVTNMDLYLDLFEGRMNPNKCPARGTFFVSSKYTNFYDVQQLYHAGHEIASNGVDNLDLPSFWYNASVSDWCQQINDNRDILSQFAMVRPSDIRGFRTPYLYMGGENQFKAYKQCGVQYDATRVALNYKDMPNLMWPYSYDQMSTQDCPNQRACPKCSYPGVWQFPLEALNDTHNVPCAEVDGCSASTKDDVYQLLRKAFDARNSCDRVRSPMMIAINTRMLLNDAKRQGLEQFMDYVHTVKNAYFVTAWEALNWVRHPTPVKPCGCVSPSEFGCKIHPPAPCDYPRECFYDKDRRFVPRGSTGVIFVMKTCASRCPGCYPALGDPRGVSC